MKTVLDCIETGTRYLQDRGIEDCRRNMQLLMAHQLGCSRTELYMCFDRPMSEDQLVPLRDLLKKRGQGTPLQHLLGTVEFRGREFRTDGRALIPRPETEELAELVLAPGFPRPARILDMGTGSGVLGLSVTADLADACREAVLVDISAAALELASENARMMGIPATFLQSDLFDGVTGEFDLIAANLPYVPEADRESLSREVLNDPPAALFAGPDGLDVYRRFVPETAERLTEGGVLAMEFGIGQEESLMALMGEAGLENPRILNDMSGTARFAIAGPA